MFVTISTSVKKNISKSNLRKKRCGGLNFLGPGSGPIRRCALVGVGMALLEEVTVDLGFKNLVLAAWKTVFY